MRVLQITFYIVNRIKYLIKTVKKIQTKTELKQCDEASSSEQVPHRKSPVTFQFSMFMMRYFRVVPHIANITD